MESTISKFSHLQIPLEEVLEATNNFDEKNVIGQGELGKVYKGKLLLLGKSVKIVARRLDSKHKRGLEFLTEISALSSLKHENIVSIIGFCNEKGEKVIINEYLAKGSLEMHLSKPTLTWVQRLKICIGVARLSYIHYQDRRSYSFIHRNINSSTILLNNKFEPKLSGFEYSIQRSVHEMGRVLITEAIGTKGYVDPAIENTGGVTYKSDIYSFGVVLFEILYMRKAFIPDVFDRFLAPLVRFHDENGTLAVIRSILNDQIGVKSGITFLSAAYSCTNDDRALRPDMNSIVNKLMEVLQLQVQYERLYRPDMERLTSKLSHMKIRLADINLATDNFSDTYFYQSTPFYDLYRAKLEHLDKKNSASSVEKRCTTVIIKRLRPREDIEGERVFGTDIAMLTTCKHRNLVSLLGFCDEDPEKILVVEDASNGYLIDYLEKDKDKDMSLLSWEKRLKICLDVAHGLKYLHYEMEDQKRVIHGDFATDSIALDEKFGAKIEDFGLSMFLPPDQKFLHLNSYYGFVFYVDPEYEETCKLRRKSDVYTFGVILFEMLSGRWAGDEMYTKESEAGIVDVARRCYRKGTLIEIIDPLIIKEADKHSIKTFVDIAYWCVAETQDRRPTMKHVVNELEKALKPNLERLKSQLSHMKIRLADIRLATDNFSRTYLCLTSGFYDVYRAEVEVWDKKNSASVENKNKSECSKRSTTVSIKRLRPGEDNEEEEVFGTDIEMLTTCKHHNIVTLLGFCDENSEKILVIEAASNGYLIEYLVNHRDRSVLTWEKRLKICHDVAYGLNYLHHEMEDQKTVIIHDLTLYSIALDENLGAKIVDFGHSMFLPPNQDSLQLNSTRGRAFYVDPEYRKTTKLTRYSDVHIFGVILFEMLYGRVAWDEMYMKESEAGLVDVARRCYLKGTLMEKIDPSIIKEANKDSIDTVVEIAYRS